MATCIKEHGGAEKILYDDYRDPAPGPDDVVVRVRACALNHVDMLLLDGRFPPPEGLPHVNGCEVAGTIETLGAGVKGLGRGRRVIIFPGFACVGGSSSPSAATTRSSSREPSGPSASSTTAPRTSSTPCGRGRTSAAWTSSSSTSGARRSRSRCTR